MLSNRLVFAAVAAACIGAAAAGGYFGARQTVVPAATEAAAPLVAPKPPDAALPTTGAAREAEATVTEPGRRPVAPVAAASAGTPSLPAKPSEPSRIPLTTPAVATSRPSPAVVAQAETPALERSAPSGVGVNSAPTPAGSAAPAPPVDASSVPRVDDRVAQEPPRAPEPPQRAFDELVVVADSVIGLQTDTTVTSDRARVEDRVEARVSRDVRVREMVAIPAGSRALGTVVLVERGGKFKERARLGIRFNTLVLADGTRLPISTETIYREGEPPGKDSASKMTGAAVGGAILGAIIGGGKGAAIGGAVGAGAGAAAVAAAERSQAVFYSGQPITVRILAPVTVTIEQK